MKIKRYRIVNKRRFFVFITFLLVLGSVLFNIILSTSRAHSSLLAYSYEEITVLEGDTLWNIAIEFMPRKYDVREMVYNIRKLNQMENAYIYPGDKIKIPIIK